MYSMDLNKCVKGVIIQNLCKFSSGDNFCKRLDLKFKYYHYSSLKFTTRLILYFFKNIKIIVDISENFIVRRYKTIISTKFYCLNYCISGLSMSKIKVLMESLIGNVFGNDRESIKGRLIYGIFWNLISAIASQGFPLIAAIIAARLLGTSWLWAVRNDKQYSNPFFNICRIRIGNNCHEIHSTIS